MSLLMGPRMNAIIIQWPGEADAKAVGVTIRTNLQSRESIIAALRITLRTLCREVKQLPEARE